DELPQLINVLRGEMSLVGPRPCLSYETELFEPHHFNRFLVPAGMTGLWQVAARAHSTMKEALDLDVAYARSWSLGPAGRRHDVTQDQGGIVRAGVVGLGYWGPNIARNLAEGTRCELSWICD